MPGVIVYTQMADTLFLVSFGPSLFNNPKCLQVGFLDSVKIRLEYKVANLLLMPIHMLRFCGLGPWGSIYYFSASLR
jgi:hypothetical protein